MVQENLSRSSYSGRNRHAGLTDRAYGPFPLLTESRRKPAGLLSGGDQQMLAIGRVMMTAPNLLVLDEPSMGLAPSVVDLPLLTSLALHKQGQPILLVERNASITPAVGDCGSVMCRGQIIIEGTPQDLRKNPDVLNSCPT